MVKTSTLIYLVDDINMPTDMILTPNEKTEEDRFFDELFSLLEYDPGEALASKILERI